MERNQFISTKFTKLIIAIWNLGHVTRLHMSGRGLRIGTRGIAPVALDGISERRRRRVAQMNSFTCAAYVRPPARLGGPQEDFSRRLLSAPSLFFPASGRGLEFCCLVLLF